MDVFLRRKDFFYHEHVLPVVAKVVVVHKLRVLARQHVAEFVFPFVFRFPWSGIIFIGYPVSLVLDDELVQVGILPAHNALQDSVELGERDVASHLDAPPDGRVRAAECHFDLVGLDGFCQSCRHREAPL